jgi:pyocin large subunit-like protein
MSQGSWSSGGNDSSDSGSWREANADPRANQLAEWGRPETLQDHFERHGPDFGSKTPQEYVRQSEEFFVKGLNNPSSTDVRVDPGTGDIRIYDRATNTLGAYNADGSTKTFFKPDPGRFSWDRSARSFGRPPRVLGGFRGSEE